MSPPGQRSGPGGTGPRTERLAGELDTQESSSTRPTSCPGCCRCLTTEPPRDTQAAHTPPAWLLPDDPTAFFRPLDFFIVQVVHATLADNTDDDSSAKLSAAWEFHKAHGMDALAEALTVAFGMTEGLDDTFAGVLATLTRRAT